MKNDQPTPRNIDEYIAGFPPDVQKHLKKIRLTAIGIPVIFQDLHEK